MSDDVKVINVPERIYLQIGDDFDPGEVDFSELQEVTWCADNIHGTDIAYVRADALEAANARLTALESERDEMMKALAECRDAMPIPEAGSSLEGHWVSAIASPLEVSGYIGECYKTLKAERDALLAAAGKEAVAELVKCRDMKGSQWFDIKVFDKTLEHGTKLYTAPAAALENGDGRDAWISVDERMPENDQIVAFVVKADQESPNWHLNGHILGGTYHENWGFSTPGVGHRASHWMPLPAAPAALSQKAGEQ